MPVINEFEPTSPQEITPLSLEERAKFETVIYKHESTVDLDRMVVMATTAAMQADGFQVVVDIDTDGSTANHAVVVRSATKDQKARITEGALFLGVIEATRRRLMETQQQSTSIGYRERATMMAKELLSTVTRIPDLKEAFSEYYGGLRWGSDQEKFVRDLFLYGSDFDPKFIEENVRSDNVSTLVYELGADISYDQRKSWRGTPVAEILNKYPELDYHQLRDETFRQSEAGQKLLRAWEYVQGDILARRQKNHEPVVTANGEVLAEPAIPLTRHPVIEALIIDEMRLDRPMPKYSFGPSELAGIVLDSDSAPAHQALVATITTRLPEGQRRVFDGPDEFQFKRGRVLDLIREYQRANNRERKALLRNDLLQILDAYSGNGSIAASVRESYDSQKARGADDWYARSEAHRVNEIMVDMLTIAFASPDKDVIVKMEEIIYGFLPAEDGMTVADNDILRLNREQIGLALLDAIDFVREGSDPVVFEVMGKHIFEDSRLGAQIGQLAQTKLRIAAEGHRPEVLRAFDERRKHFNRFGEEQSPAYVAAQQNYNQLTAQRDELITSVRRSQQELYLSQTERLAETQTQRSLSNGEEMLFDGFVKRMKLGAYDMRALPSEYYRMVAMAKSGELTQSQQSRIVWQLSESFRFIDKDAARLMVQVVLDIYEIALGLPYDVKFPTHDTGHILSAASNIVGEHGRGIFESASREDLQRLASYGEMIRDFADRITNNQLLPNSAVSTDGGMVADGPEWRTQALRNLAEVARSLQAIDEYYREYLLIEAVKVLPSEYYSWLLSKLTPFWKKMQWEVGPGNQPSQDIKSLHQTIADYIRYRFVFLDQYPVDFDVAQDGQLDTFLKEMYEQMVTNKDIQYSGAVWNEGLTFMHNAVAYMPEAVLRQLEDRFPGTNFVKYVQTQRARWNKPETSGVV